jgi:putative ABC transport system permease protein
VWLVASRDLRWRRRRFAIGVVATALVFAITLLLTGVTAFFRNEVRRTVAAIDVDRWIVPAGVTGPFTSTRFLPESTVAEVAELPGVQAASGLILFRQAVRVDKLIDVNVIGSLAGRAGTPKVSEGREVENSGEIVVDASLDKGVGDGLKIGKQDFKVVGVTHGITYFAGSPTVFISVGDAQRLLFSGQKLITTVVTKGTPTSVPATLGALTNDEVRADMRRPISVAGDTIGFINVLLWVIAAGIIAAVLYMSALERVGDFAVLKATGASNRFVVSGLAIQAVILAIAAAIVAVVIALLLVPGFPVTVEIPARAYVILFVVSLAVGVLGSLAGLRRALTVDPALAFGA